MNDTLKYIVALMAVSTKTDKPMKSNKFKNQVISIMKNLMNISTVGNVQFMLFITSNA